MSTPINMAILSARAANCLRQEGLTTIEQLLPLSDDQLMRIPNAGRKTVREIRQVILGDILQMSINQLVRSYGRAAVVAAVQAAA